MVKDVAWFLPASSRKTQEERCEEEGRTKSKRKQGLMKWDILGYQIAKDTKIRSITFKKKCSGYKAKGVAG